MKSDFDGLGGLGSGVAADVAGAGAAKAGAGKKRRVGKGRMKGERRWKRWLKEARARGMSEMELVVEMHLCRGLELEKVAVVLGKKVGVVRWLWRQSRAGSLGGISAPRSEADFVLLREQVGAMLWHTVVETSVGLEAEEDDAAKATKRAVSLLGVRLKALRQIAVLYDVNPKRKAKAQDPRFEQVEPATPEEVSELVRKWREERGEGLKFQV